MKNRIEEILAKKAAATNGIERQVEKLTKVYNCSNFFGADGKKGISSPQEYLEYINSLSEKELRNYALFLEHVSNKVKLNIPPYTSRFDVNNEEYYNVSVDSKQVNTRYNLRSAPFISAMIKIYTFDLACFNLNFDELYDMAINDSNDLDVAE